MRLTKAERNEPLYLLPVVSSIADLVYLVHITQTVDDEAAASMSDE